MDTTFQLSTLFKNRFVVLAIFIVLSLALYFNALFVGYISDDWRFVLQMEKYGWSAFTHNFSDEFFIPISHFIGGIVYNITSGNSTIQHIIQIMIQAICAWQLFLLTKQIGQLTKQSQTNYFRIGFILGVFFIVSPYQTESTIWLASKSYGYTLLFSLLAIRFYIKYTASNKGLYLFLIFLSLAIHSKEWAYVLPIITTLILLIARKKVKTSFILGSFSIISVSLLIRYYFLGHLIGGYGSEVHNVSVSQVLDILRANVVHAVKLVSYGRHVGFYTGILITVVIITSLIWLTKNVETKYRILAGLVGIFFFSLLPMANLEITSFHEIQSDRYSYFCMIPLLFCFSWAFDKIIREHKEIGYTTLSIFILFNGFLTVKNTNVWNQSAIAQETFLEALNKKMQTNSRVLLINIPDTYQGVYCIRNGIEPYLEVKGKIVDIEIFQRQNFTDQNGGYIKSADALWYLNQNSKDTYKTFPTENTSYRTPFHDEWLDLFNEAYYYGEKTFNQIK